MNLEVPTGLAAGDTYLDIAGPDSYTSEAKISVGSGSTAALSARASASHPAPRPLPNRPAVPSFSHRSIVDRPQASTATGVE